MTTRSGSAFGENQRMRIWECGNTRRRNGPPAMLSLSTFHSTAFARVRASSCLAISLSLSSGIIGRLLGGGRERAGPAVHLRLQTSRKRPPLIHGKPFLHPAGAALASRLPLPQLIREPSPFRVVVGKLGHLVGQVSQPDGRKDPNLALDVDFRLLEEPVGV